MKKIILAALLCLVSGCAADSGGKSPTTRQSVGNSQIGIPTDIGLNAKTNEGE
jgi:hypothetical protein